MGKNKRQKLSSKPAQKRKLQGKGARPTGISKSQPSQSKKPSKPHTQLQHTRPIIPFSPHDSILLIGEGDLSFARSLVSEHHCSNLTATVYESSSELLKKYPHVRENFKAIEEGGCVVRYGVDAGKRKLWTDGKRNKGNGVMDRIIFNFPHVGGKSTDINRQVRYNQELLVSFFKNAIPSLSPKPGSSIIVTLFEGEPYTLWNIRDLARHSGLQVQQSFKFQAKAYPGYKHARTLGVVKGEDGKEGGGWKGEERSARSYVFVRRGDPSAPVVGPGKKKDERSEDEESGEEFDDEEMDENEYEDEEAELGHERIGGK